MKQTIQGKISQCMIVKNEEKNIEQALSWGKGVVAEQIVVDTGSADRTVEIAQRLGAKVFHFPWINDFAAAKNFAIEKAQYEWIAFLDADEYFSAEDAKKLADVLHHLSAQPVDSVMTAWIHLYDDKSIMQVDSQTRIARRYAIMVGFMKFCGVRMEKIWKIRMRQRILRFFIQVTVRKQKKRKRQVREIFC